MNAIPQKAHNYERIQIPRNNSNRNSQRMGKITDMQAYNMQKIAMQRQKAYEERQAYEAQRRQQRAMEAMQERRALREEREAVARQTNVKNIVGGRKLTPAYEVSAPARGYAQEYGRRGYGYAGGQTAARIRRQEYGSYERTYDRRQPRMAQSRAYAAPRRAPIHGFDMVESAASARETTYGGVKPIAVEYEAPKKKGFVSTIILIVVIFAMLAGVVIRYAQISDLNRQNAQVETRIAALKQDLEKAKVNRALSEDLSSVRERAAQLGMAEPTDGQLVYLQPEELGATEAPAGEGQNLDAEDMVTAEGQTTLDDAGQGGTENAVVGDVDGVAGFFQTILDTIKGWFSN